MNDNETHSSESKTIFKKDILNILVGGIIGIIPGILLWILMSYLDFVAGIVGFFITAGSLLGYKYFAKNTKQSGIAICMVLSIVTVLILDVAISTYSLRKQYQNSVTDSEIKSVSEDLVEKLEDISEDERKAYLAEYNIKSLEDKEGLERYARNTYNETFLKNNSISKIPDTYSSAFSGLRTMLVRNRTLKLSKLFLTNILTGIAFSVLAGLVITNSRFFYTFDIDNYDDDDEDD